MTTPGHEFTAAANALATEGWCVISHLMTELQTRALADECHAMHSASLLLPARTGSARSSSRLRGDSTHWFDQRNLTPAQQDFSDRIDALRIDLGRELMLALVDCEAHYAVYSPGAVYARHLDRLRDNDARVMSAVFYLNDDWLDSEGGALRLYLADGSTRDIYPRAGSLLLFLSAHFEHEVLPATRDRMSIACWMRQRALV
ncbi:MAG: 2OG-Fe(II) oxygenase [Rhodanobacter sp.]